MDSHKLIPIAKIIKKHTFKENKWKAVSLSGLASIWFENLSAIYLSDGNKDAPVKVPVKIEVPLSHSEEFFLLFEGTYAPPEKAEILVPRSEFPPLPESEFYLCDVIGTIASSKLGDFKVISYFENADPKSGLSALSLLIESVSPIAGKALKLEVPASILKRKDNSWSFEDIELWTG